MDNQVEHKLRFDAAGKLDADASLMVPRAGLRHDFAADGALADDIVRRYFEAVIRGSRVPLTLENGPQGVRLRAPLGKTALVLAEPERIVEEKRVETSWRIAGGYLLAPGVSYGGRLYVGAEWVDGGLKLYSSVRRFPPRLVSWLGLRRGVGVYERWQAPHDRRVHERFLQAVARGLQ